MNIAPVCLFKLFKKIESSESGNGIWELTRISQESHGSQKNELGKETEKEGVLH